MKIRNGFVSNSSSSSFCIYGVSDGEEIFDKFKRDHPKFKEYVAKYDMDPERVSSGDIEEFFWSIDSAITVSNPCDYGSYYVGLSMTSIRDDETGAQFKERVKEAVSEYFDISDMRFSIYEEGWYDG